jgi:hypothetical protein
MSSNRKSRASRANGAKSSGPKTTESKARSAASNLKHGLLAHTIVLKEENIQAFTDLLAALEREFHPKSETELALVHNMAAGRWRLIRILAIERATLQIEMEKHDPGEQPPSTRAAISFRTLADDSHCLQLLARYEARYDRQFTRSLSILLKLQRDRQDLPPAAEPVVPENVPEKPILPTDLVPKTDTNNSAPNPPKDAAPSAPAAPDATPVTPSARRCRWGRRFSLPPLSPPPVVFNLPNHYHCSIQNPEV